MGFVLKNLITVIVIVLVLLLLVRHTKVESREVNIFKLKKCVTIIGGSCIYAEKITKIKYSQAASMQSHWEMKRNVPAARVGAAAHSCTLIIINK